MAENRSWMYNRILTGRRGYSTAFLEGLEEFLAFATQQPNLESEGKIRCPCKKCKNNSILSFATVKYHLLKSGFMDNYYYWTCHGEQAPPINPFYDADTVNVGGSSNVHRGETSRTSNMSNYNYVDRYEDMIYDAARLGSTNFGEPNMEETPNIDANRFYNMLNQAQEPLWSGCETHSALSAAVRMMSLKSDYNMPEECFNEICQYMSETLPPDNKSPVDFYKTKQMVAGLGMTSMKIDCCVNGCMLYWKDDEYRRKCKFCEMPRYKEHRGQKKTYKDVPRQRMHYLPLIPRLQRLFASNTTATHMRWHNEHVQEEGVIRHPSDGEAWRHFDRIHPTFASEPRNVRLGLCTDGFNPFGNGATPYSCWPVIVTPYNLPPELCMTSPYMFLTMIIPGPRNPKSKIDVYLQPLIDELKQLWSEGVWTFDVSMNQNFKMRASLMWTIGDFPAYGMLSGWSTAGKLACPICMKNGKGFRLKEGRKNSWFDCHRKFLRQDHPYRRNTNDFKVGKKEFSIAPPRLTGDELWDEVCHIPRIVDTGSQIRFNGYGEEHNWTKRNIFWDLPYWKDNLIQHNLDVMHIEKNVFDNVFHTVMDNTDRTKDNVKARLDLQEICQRRDLHLQPIGNGKYRKPKASYCFTRSQKDDICEWIQGLKMPDNYASNIARCVDTDNARLFGMKSHDCHIFMQRLLPIAFSALPVNVLNSITELSQFFRDLCSTVLREEHLLSMEENIPIILCKLERIFPPAFFDVMEHLPVHLPYEARMGGPVHYRWMYPFERFLNKLKKTVKNKARVEGSICQAFLTQEISYFSSHYFGPQVKSSRTRVRRNDYGVVNDDREPSLSVFNLPGRTSGTCKERWLNDKELAAAQLHVLLNCEEVKPFIDMYVNEYKKFCPTASGAAVDRQIDNDFPRWFAQNVSVLTQGMPHCSHLYYLAMGPLRNVTSWPVMFVNGYKFHTIERGEFKRTYNSGVCVGGTSHDASLSDYYGQLKEILELEWPGLPVKKLVLFNCEWFDPSPRGTRVHPKYGIVEVKKNRQYAKYDPFIFASTAIQSYYCPYPKRVPGKADWWVATKTASRFIVESRKEMEIAYQNDQSHSIVPIEDDPVDNLCDYNQYGTIEIVLNIGHHTIEEAEEEQEEEEEDEDDDEEEDEDNEDEDDDDDDEDEDDDGGDDDDGDEDDD